MAQRVPTMAIQFFSLLGLWLIFAARATLRDLLIGVVVALYLVLINQRHLKPLVPNRLGQQAKVRWGHLFFSFIPWLVYQIISANVQVAMMVLRPISELDPKVLICKTGLRNEIALTFFANAITLTPGTISVDVKPDHLIVHTIESSLAGGLFDGELEQRVADVFTEVAIDPDVVTSLQFPEPEEPIST